MAREIVGDRIATPPRTSTELLVLKEKDQIRPDVQELNSVAALSPSQQTMTQSFRIEESPQKLEAAETLTIRGRTIPAKPAIPPPPSVRSLALKTAGSRGDSLNENENDTQEV